MSCDGAPPSEPIRWQAEYVTPLRWEDDGGLGEFTRYLRRLSRWLDVTVVDGSEPDRFSAHHALWPFVRHVTPTWPGTNGKARGAMTGLFLARHDRVIVADDDVRSDVGTLQRMLDLLEQFDMVRPQNHFDALPWHARWDTARTLVSRACGGDFSGTVGVRRSLVVRGGGYDTTVLFENLELERTVRARGGRVRVARDLLITRRPPTTARFWEQRVRQAYDEFARPARMLIALGVLPALLWLSARGAWRLLLAAAVGVVALAEAGRRRDGGAAAFSSDAALWAPMWALERAVTVWLALGLRLRGGVRYRDVVLRRAATPLRRLRREPA